MENCIWKKDDPFESDRDFETGCGKKWSFIEDGIKENDISFCPFCGKRIEEYHEVKEIRPHHIGELWETESGFKLFTCKDEEGELVLKREDGYTFSLNNLPDNLTCLFPKVEDDSVERIEIESVFFKGYENFRDQRTAELNFLACQVDFDIYPKLRTLDHSTPMKVILEFSKT